MRRPILALAVGAACVVGAAGCGNANVVTPADVAQNYVYQVAEGNYPAACALLDPRTRETLVSAAGSALSCPRLLARCLPAGSTALRHDPVQLLYANVELQVHGPRAEVGLSGTTVASAAKAVTLVRRHAVWRLTSPGRSITRCVGRLIRDRRRGPRRRVARG